jgi:hypothetical protein
MAANVWAKHTDSVMQTRRAKEGQGLCVLRAQEDCTQADPRGLEDGKGGQEDDGSTCFFRILEGGMVVMRRGGFACGWMIHLIWRFHTRCHGQGYFITWFADYCCKKRSTNSHKNKKLVEALKILPFELIQLSI